MRRPARCDSRVAGDPQQFRPKDGTERHFNFGQRIGYAFSGRLQEGFLSRPAMEKRLEHRVPGESFEHGLFVRGEEFRGHAVRFGNRSDPFNLLTSPSGPSVSLDVMRRFLGRLLPPFFFAS